MATPEEFRKRLRETVLQGKTPEQIAEETAREIVPEPEQGNFFDQFDDEPVPEEAPPVNFFDQFDEEKSPVTDEVVYTPTEGMGVGEKALVGIGRGFVDVGNVGGQLGLTAAEKIAEDPTKLLALPFPLNMVLGAQVYGTRAMQERGWLPSAKEFQEGVQEDVELWEKHADLPMKVGRVGGQIAPSLVIPGAAATVPGRMVLGAAGGAMAGAAGGAGEDVEDIGRRAVVGGTVGAAIPGGLATARAAGTLAKGARETGGGKALAAMEKYAPSLLQGKKGAFARKILGPGHTGDVAAMAALTPFAPGSAIGAMAAMKAAQVGERIAQKGGQKADEFASWVADKIYGKKMARATKEAAEELDAAAPAVPSTITPSGKPSQLDWIDDLAPSTAGPIGSKPSISEVLKLYEVMGKTRRVTSEVVRRSPEAVTGPARAVGQLPARAAASVGAQISEPSRPPVRKQEKFNPQPYVTYLDQVEEERGKEARESADFVLQQKSVEYRRWKESQ